MDIAAVVNIHKYNSVVDDTLDSIFAYCTRDVLLIVDGLYWNEIEDKNLPVSKVCGFKHGVPKSPYRNVALGLQMMVQTWPDKEWFCYSEPDTLFASKRYAYNLQMASERDVWMLGSNGRVDEQTLPLIDAMLEKPLRSCYYLLGCCLFFHRNFIAKLLEINFFERFLNLTNGFAPGHFPAYGGYDISEHLYPSLCRHFGGNIGVFSSWDERKQWHGSYKYFPMRWNPDIDPETENFPSPSIIHPLKDFDHPIRSYHRQKRANGS